MIFEMIYVQTLFGGITAMFGGDFAKYYLLFPKDHESKLLMHHFKGQCCD